MSQLSTSSSSSSVEVLVHISAPGSVRDDTRYRSHASACLAFEPGTRTRLTPLDEAPPSSRDEGETTFGSFSSSWPCTQEALPEAEVQVQDTPTPTSTPTPPSTVPDSAGGSPLRYSEAESDRTDTPTPTPTPTPPLTWTGIERNTTPDASPIKPVPVYISISSETSTSLSEHVQSQVSTQVSTQEVSQPSPTSPHTDMVGDELQFPMEIHPPHPIPSSTARFKTHLTPALRMLVSHPKLSRRYAPVYTARDLRVCERGYWFIRVPLATSTVADGGGGWSAERFMRFWGYLGEAICGGSCVYVGRGGGRDVSCSLHG
ncbi:hypothetical protein TESG_08103 [Trichophyton tonsurans CBS 112818]|uniref:Uncharacterized protein n=1 Tax=Trichophyton tonsurans (strain CBS 112818) TaxID=647933 RepID=F2SB95_TRIT1|nr:hypothetical protein TESG_08103 [Trichophyton tonsurans CBS 112818]